MILINASLLVYRKLCSARRFCSLGIGDDSMTSLAIASVSSTKTKNAGGFSPSIYRWGVLGRILVRLAIPIMLSRKALSAGGVGL
jgi:hypothetical protein